MTGVQTCALPICFPVTIIAGIAHDKSEAKVTIVGVPARTGVAAAIFQAIADADINIDMIVQNVSAAATGLTDISFTLPKTEGSNATSVLKRIQGEIGFASIQYDDQIGKLSLIGAGMRSHPGVTANFFACLSEAGVNIEMISTSEFRISIVSQSRYRISSTGKLSNPGIAPRFNFSSSV